MKLNGIVCCVNYDDYLSYSLPENIKHFDSFVVVTDAKDKATQDLAKRWGAICVIRSSETPFDASGTKGQAINEGLALLPKKGWLLHLDADIILPDTFRKDLEEVSLDHNDLYWVTRKQPSTELQLKNYFADKRTINAWDGCNPPGSPNRWSGPFGYFQLFNPEAVVLQNFDTVYPESSATQEWLELAEKGLDFDWRENIKVVTTATDGIFNQRWPENQKVKLDDSFTVLHLPHGPSRVNWSGRKSARFSFPSSPAGFFE